MIEDTADLGAAIVARLRGQGHAVEWLTDGGHASRRLQEDPFDLIILDLMLPGINGSDLLKLVRSRRIHTPVLVITARGDLGDKINVLDIGADDYLVKPFDLRELEARMRAVVRRHSGMPTSRIEIGDVTVDIAAQSVIAAGTRIELTRREFRLLELLVLSPGQVVPRERLMDQLFGYENAVNPNALELYISRIRRRLKPTTLRIQTVWGTGYVAKIDDADAPDLH
ncbi:response regulator transcription factor [Bradyrhizobium erythrophlei]|uniref:response regulator transcription factor n=1 Tax=Bradyrhizobium erythrophlei TaxID=1437360 RepID=UPI0035E60F71